jgi:hypothetical protein
LRGIWEPSRCFKALEAELKKRYDACWVAKRTLKYFNSMPEQVAVYFALLLDMANTFFWT